MITRICTAFTEGRIKVVDGKIVLELAESGKEFQRFDVVADQEIVFVQSKGES